MAETAPKVGIGKVAEALSIWLPARRRVKGFMGMAMSVSCGFGGCAFAAVAAVPRPLYVREQIASVALLTFGRGRRP
ncbi:MAG: hypothetical protein AB7O56_07425 [Bauldia sp.]